MLENWPSQGRITCNDVTLRYRQGLDLALRGVTLDIEGSEKIGICGRTGCGKSSLLKCLVRLIEIEDGSIEVDGLNIQEVPLHVLRSRINVVPQNPVLFEGSLRYNLDPTEMKSDEQIWNVLDLVGMGPVFEDLSFEVEEGGSNLSVGERQLLCIARAMLRESKILLIDEGTANVDSERDDAIQRVLRDHYAESTVLTVAHRLQTILDCDRIAVLDDGLVVESGAPQMLLEDGESALSDLAAESKKIAEEIKSED